MYSTEKIRTEALLMTPELARHLRDDCHYERQRPIAERHIKRLQFEIEAGRFIEGTQIHLCVRPDGSMVIVNGNHTLEAVYKSETAIPLTVLYTLVENDHEIAAIYARHDIHRTRTWAAALKAAGVADELDTTTRTKFASAMRVIMDGLNSTWPYRSDDPEIAFSRDVRIAAMQEYEEYAKLYVTAVSGNSKSRFSQFVRAPIFAVALETMRFQPNAAFEFWSTAAKDDGLRRNDPRKKLLTFLQENRSNSNTFRDHVQAAALCWNSFYRGDEQLQYLRLTASSFYLLGTPWTKNGGRPRPLDAMVKQTKAGQAQKEAGYQTSLMASGVKPNGDGSLKPTFTLREMLNAN